MSVDDATVARMAVALQMIVDHHQPEEYRGGLTCIACTYLAGIPMAWPCVNRSFVGDLIPDASNALLPIGKGEDR